MEKQNLGIGLAGVGTVGTGVVLTLERNHALIGARTDGKVRLEIAKALVRDVNKPRPVHFAPGVMTTRWQDLIEDPAVDLLVELIGGTTTAREIVSAALRARKPVVTGNKALLAEHGTELFALSREFATPIHFEAAVAGGIPIIKTVQESFVGNRIHSMTGILNGTSNYILERMTSSRLSFLEALDEAREQGYAEADPTLDINGWDAAHKAILLATLAYGFSIDPARIHVAGIEQVRGIDIDFATRLGYVIKLLAIIRQHSDESVEIRVQPSFVPQKHILASVNGVFNAVAVHGDAAGESLFYGRGAGQDPTASSVLADLVEAARALLRGDCSAKFLPYRTHGRIVPVEETQTPYYVRFDVTDRPGVIAAIADVLARAGIGISGIHSPVNPEKPDAAFVDMVFLLHPCPFGRLQEALAKVETLDSVNSTPVVFRIETI